ncbi:unnamed protein product [Rotaria magnacalcarata]|uniref:Uncharacterized protein n=2 Tax=Rotaria magnacalcarata TaxID=392030 RepID=A0A816MJR9_9BILA|nr:unnamed protein product [Rotaria magnacalcarata]CAF4977038.1 unnamed protein product [Rotaria magnacalcarata]
MEPFTPEILTVVVLIAVILSGVTFVAFIILIICLIRSKHRRVKAEIGDNDDNDADDDDALLVATSNDLSHARSPSISSSLSSSIQTPAARIPMVQIPRKKKLPPTPKHRPHVISVLEEYSSDDQMKHKHVYRYDESGDTIITNDSRLQNPDPQQKKRHAKSFKPVIESNFATRETPYPPDIIKREQFMVAIRGIPNNKYT